MARALWLRLGAVAGVWILAGALGEFMGVAYAQERVEILAEKHDKRVEVKRGVALAAKPESRLDSTKVVDSADLTRVAQQSSTPESTNTPAYTSAKKLLLLFGAKSCQPCRTLESNLAQIAPALESGFALYKLDIYEKSPIMLPLSSTPVSIKALRHEFGVIATPTLVAFDDEFLPIFIYQGVLSVRELAYLLELLQALPPDLLTKDAKSQWVKSQLLAFSRAAHAPAPSISTPISTQGQP